MDLERERPDRYQKAEDEKAEDGKGCREDEHAERGRADREGRGKEVVGGLVQPYVENEKEKPITVNYDELVKSWQSK